MPQPLSFCAVRRLSFQNIWSRSPLAAVPAGNARSPPLPAHSFCMKLGWFPHVTPKAGGGSVLSLVTLYAPYCVTTVGEENVSLGPLGVPG